MATAQDPTPTGRPTPKKDEDQLGERSGRLSSSQQTETDGSPGSEPGKSDTGKVDKGF